jgi:Carbohydrate esterase, sialic acid-specific acetylesterase/Bacterial Ig-like domain (group 3)
MNTCIVSISRILAHAARSTRFALLAILWLASGLILNAATVSLLNNNNPSFETSIGYPAGAVGLTNSIPGWQCYWSIADSGVHNVQPQNNAYPATESSPPDGTNAFGLSVSTGCTFWLETDAATRPPVQPNTSCTISFAMEFSSTIATAATVGMSWYNSAGQLISRSTGSFTPGNSWSNYTLTATSPANAASVAAYYTVTANSTYKIFTYLDNFSIQMQDNSNGGAGGSLAPVARAGLAQTNYLGIGAQLAGYGFDYYYRSLTYAWSVVSGPGTVVFANSNSPATSANFSTNGVYTLRLSVNNGLTTVSNDVQVTMLPTTPNLFLSNPGFELSSGAYLDGSGGPGSDLSMTGWQITFNNTGVSNSIYVNPPAYEGSQALYASALQPKLPATNTTILETASANRAAVVAGRLYHFSYAASNPGSNYIIGVRWYNSSGTLVRQDAKTPNLTVFYGSWQTFAIETNAPAGAQWAAAYFSLGQGFMGVDAFSLWSYPDGNNVAPVISAGANQTNGLGTVTQLTGSAADADGDALTYSWAQISGPGTASFSDSTSLTPWVAFSTNAPGTYDLRLSVNDGHGHIVTADTYVTVKLFTGEKILIFAGQSNMEGLGSEGYVPANPNPIPNVYGFFSNPSDTDGKIFGNYTYTPGSAPSSYGGAPGASFTADPGGTPDPYGLYVYQNMSNFDGTIYNEKSWMVEKTTNGVKYAGGTWLPGYGQPREGSATNGVYFAGGSWQPYAYWLRSYTGWTRKGPVTFNKTGNFWYMGLNAGETWANATSYSTGEPVQEYGPEFGFVQAVHAAYPTNVFNVVKYAPGGTSLWNDWNPANNAGCYNGMIQWIKAALQQKPGATPVAFCWLQGESDAINTSQATNYFSNMTNFIQRLRADLGIYNLPVIIVKISPGNFDPRQNPAEFPNFSNQSQWTNSNYGIYYTGSTNGIAAVRQAQADVCNNDPNTKAVETAGFALETSDWYTAHTFDHSLTKSPAIAAVHYNVVTNQYYAPFHFTGPDLQTIGTNMAANWLSIYTNWTPMFTNFTLAVSQSASVTAVAGTVSFTGTVQISGSLATNATGTMIFSTVSGPFSTNTVTGGIASSTAITNLPIGTSTISFAYSGDATYPALTSTLTHQVIGKGTDYFVNPTSGNDANLGTNWAQAFQHIATAIAAATPGSVIHLLPGATFNENVSINKSGIASLPIILACDDPVNRAIISQASSASEGVLIYNQSWITLQNVIVVGQGGAATTKFGVSAYADNGQYTALTFSNLTVSGFYRGFVVGGWGAANYGFNTVSLLSCQASNNLDCGGLTYGYAVGAISNIVVQGCIFNNNPGDPQQSKNSGNGLYLSAVINGLIDHCVAHDNGGAGTNVGGPAGLWCSSSRGIVIQYCESYRNLAQQRDGDGFDLDVSTTGSIIQYCYAHGNVGAGFLLNGDGYSSWNNNTVRYCVSENDSTGTNHYGSLEIYCPDGPVALANCQIYNNTFFNKLDYAVNINGTNLASVFLRNNILVVTNGNAIVAGSVSTNQALFQGNDYWSSGGAWNVAGVSSLTAWRNTGQEMVNGTNVGFNLDPKLKNAGNGGTIGNAYALTNLIAYQLQTNSPAIDTGLNLTALFGINSGLADFYGVSLPQNTNYDIGASESLAAVIVSTTTATTVTSSVNPSTYGSNVTFTATIKPASGVVAPTGSVQFKVDGVPLGAVVTLIGVGTNGIASLTTNNIPVAGSPHVITAEYAATGNFLNSTNTLAGGQTVNYAVPVVTGSPAITAGGSFQMTFTGPAGQTYVVLSSTNLALPQASWTPVASGTFTGSPVTYTNLPPLNGQTFFRVKSP